MYEPAGPWEDGRVYSEGRYQELKALVADGENERALLAFLRDAVELPDPQIDELRAAPKRSARVAEAPTVPRDYRAPSPTSSIPSGSRT